MGALKEILLQFLVALLCTGSIAGILMGVALLLNPDKLVRANHYFSRWISADTISAQLNRPRWSERYYYRHHRLIGSALLLGGVFVFHTFVFSSNLRKISAAVPSGYWWILDASVGLLIASSILAVLVGIIVLAKPSLLRDLEQSSNRWVSTDGVAKYFDRMIHSADRRILGHRKLAGVFLIVCSLYVLFALGYLLLRGGLKFY